MSIEEILEVIIGAKMIDIGRAANMVWIIFKKNEYEYSLHLQCPFRFEINDKVFVAQGDIYYPNSSFSGDYDDFDYDIQGGNSYDEKVLLLKDKYYVQECFVEKFNDLRMHFSENVILRTFSNDTQDDEQWRFFEYDGLKSREEIFASYENGTAKPHLVVSCNDYTYMTD